MTEVRTGTGGVLEDGTTNHPPIDFDAPPEPKEPRSPRTEAASEPTNARYALAEWLRGYYDDASEFPALVDAIEAEARAQGREQAATEARRELLAKVESMPTARVISQWDLVSRAAVRRLIEEAP